MSDEYAEDFEDDQPQGVDTLQSPTDTSHKSVDFTPSTNERDRGVSVSLASPLGTSQDSTSFTPSPSPEARRSSSIGRARPQSAALTRSSVPSLPSHQRPQSARGASHIEITPNMDIDDDELGN